jgi:hypothetical protein
VDELEEKELQRAKRNSLLTAVPRAHADKVGRNDPCPQRAWKEAKTKCKLSEEAIRMAKEMGLNPLSLIKNIPSPQQRWKAPVEEWVRDMYEGRRLKAEIRKQQKLALGANSSVPLRSNMASE